jgi:predicted alpha-1,6-mannanase (GH76 family)
MQDTERLSLFVKHGDDGAFIALVDRYAALVTGVAMRKTGDRQTAEEVAQNSFAILARKAGQLTGRKDLAGWLVFPTGWRGSRKQRPCATSRWPSLPAKWPATGSFAFHRVLARDDGYFGG